MFKRSRRIESLIEEIAASNRRMEKNQEDVRAFIKEQTARMEMAANKQERALNAQAKEIEDQREQIRAMTDATWAMVDLLRGNGGHAPAT